jgi:hypothetical protein
MESPCLLLSNKTNNAETQTLRSRKRIMGILRCIFYSAALLALVGCGGGGNKGGGQTAEVTGIVTDFNGNVVRGARVWINQFGETDSNSSGAYVLDGITQGEFKVRAEIVRDGIRYQGENTVRVFEGIREKSVNITVIRESQIARVFGTVVDNQGFLVENARVFAIAPNDGGVYSSSFEITNNDGEYDLDALLGGVDYKIVASGIGYNSDVDVVNVPEGGSEELLLVLKNATDPLLVAPTGLSGVAWTSPSEVTRSPQLANSIANIKRIFDPRTPKRKVTRETINGNWIETDLFWDAYPDSDAHIGFGIFRRFGSSGSFGDPYFLWDPQAETFIDGDSDLQEFETWEYQIRALNTNYDLTNNSESDPSNTVSVETLGDLFLQSVLQGPLRFRWETGSGAEEFIVYLFDEYPGIDVDPVWQSARVTGTQTTYNGSALQSGHRYYYLVLGLANSDTSRTITQVDSFIAN